MNLLKLIEQYVYSHKIPYFTIEDKIRAEKLYLDYAKRFN